MKDKENKRGLSGPAPSERPHPNERRNKEGIRIGLGDPTELPKRITTFSALVKHEPGVLSKVSGLFARRRFNIESLTVGPAGDINNARITIVVDENETGIIQVKKQLAKLFPVLSVKELSNTAIERELCLMKIKEGHEKEDIENMVSKYGLKMIDSSQKIITIEITGDRLEIDMMIEKFDQFEIKEIARTGIAALERGSKKTT